MIKAIFFDIGGVLLDIHIEKTYQFLSDCIDVDKNIIKQRFPWDAHDDMKKVLLTTRNGFLSLRILFPNHAALKSPTFGKLGNFFLAGKREQKES